MLVEVGHQLRAELGERFQQRAFGTVVGHEQDEGVVELALLAQVIDDPADVPVHALDHRRVDLHGSCGNLLLFIAQRVPLRAELNQRVRFDVCLDQTQCLEFFQAFEAQHLRAGVITATVFLDDLGRCLQRPVRRGEGQVSEERPGLIAFLEVLQQLVAEGIGGIEILRQLVNKLIVLDVQRRGGFQQARRLLIVGRLETIVVGSARQQ